MMMLLNSVRVVLRHTAQIHAGHIDIVQNQMVVGIPSEQEPDRRNDADQKYGGNGAEGNP